MTAFDLRSVVFSYIVTDLVSTLVMLKVWQQNRDRYAGTLLWVIDFVCQTAALVLIALRAAIPAWLSIDLSNLLVIVGSWLGLLALEKFVGRQGKRWPNYLIIVVFAAVHTWFTYVRPDLAVRTLNTSVAMCLIFLQIIWLIFHEATGELRRMMAGVGYVFGAYCLVNLARIVDFFVTDHPSNDYFHTNGFEAYVLLAYQTLFILLIYNLVLMFNKRLLGEIASGEEKFSKAFHSSPYAILLTRATDGKILEANEGFMAISGYQHEEVIGKTSGELQFWKNSADRIKVIEELHEKRKVHEQEFQFMVKSGDAITCLFSAEIIGINGEDCILSSINNINDRKLEEEQLRETTAYLENLFDYANAPIIVWDNNFRITKFNHAFERLTGRSLQEVRGERPDMLFPPGTRAASLAHLDKTSKGERWETVEIEIQDVWGTVKTVLWNSANIYDSKNKKIVATIAQGHDITERRQALEKINRFRDELEEQVKQRTAELNKTIAELEEQGRIFVGRELRLVELKKRIAELEEQLSSGKTKNKPNL